MIRTSPVVLAAQDGPWAQIRTGTVVAASGSVASVLVGAATFPASVVVPFGIPDPAAAVPAPGTLVAVGRQDSSWTVFGSILGVSGNLIPNGSFEDGIPGEPPPLWTLYQVSGEATALTEFSSLAVAGDQVAAVDVVAGPSTSLLYSEPVPVVTGQRVQLAAFAGAVYDEGVAQDADAAVLALWLAQDTDVYPTTSAPDSVVASAVDVVPVPPWTSLSGNVISPVTGFVRIALRSVLTAGQTMLWDFATVRTLS